MREQMYNCQKWLANSLKAGSAAPVGQYFEAPPGALPIDRVLLRWKKTGDISVKQSQSSVELVRHFGSYTANFATKEE